VTAEVLVFVHDPLRVDDAAPLDVQRHSSGNCGNGRNVQAISHEPLPIRKVIEQIVSIHYGNVVHSQRRETFVKIGPYRIVRGWDNPEKPIRRDSGAVVVSLFAGIEERRVCGIEIVRVELTLVNVESNEHERAVVVVTVLAYVLAPHGAHVSAKRKRPRIGVVCEGDAASGPKTSNHGVENQTVKVADL
jgi:hypothetical protein